jgi:hypothetical protein
MTRTTTWIAALVLALLSLPVAVSAQTRPDLVVVSPFTLPGAVVAGGTYPMSAVVRNQGTGGSQFNCIGYYLSADNTWDATDAFLGSGCQTLLFPGQSGTCSITATIPPLTTAGSRFLLLVADPLNAEQELNETNNVVAFPLTVSAGGNVLPDLELWRPSISFAAVPPGGSTGAFTFINNRGPGGAPAYEIGFYLSADTVFSASTDVFLGLVTGGLSLPSGTIHSAPVLPIPPTTVPGNYYLVIMADPRNVVAETNETNNSRALALRITGPLTAIGSAALPALAVYPTLLARGEKLNIVLEAGKRQPVAVEVLDNTGRVVLRHTGPEGAAAVQLETAALPAGLYSVRIRTAAVSVSKRIAIE